MLRKLMIGPVLAIALSLGACASGGGGGPIPADTVSQIQATARQVCGFVPTVSTVASVIATFTGGGAIVDMVSQVANGICTAISAKGVRRGATPKYRGVVIRGDYVGR